MKQNENAHSQVTMRDVAKVAGVSRMTVSRALKKDSPVSKETRDHILAVVREMNYVPDQLAGSLASKKTGFVAALLPSLNNLHFAQTVQGLTEELEKTGLQILLGHTDYNAEREEAMVEALLRRRPEAMVLSYDGHTERTRTLLSRASIPLIEVWEKPEQPLGYTVGFSNQDASYKMTKALIAKGYQNLVFLGEQNDDWTRGAARRQGFVAAMREHCLDATRVLRRGVPPLSISAGANAAADLLGQFPDVDCVFCVSDLAAFGLLEGLRDAGKSVPEDVSVVGFGNFEVSRFSTPSLSTVVVDPLAIGRQAGRLINALLLKGEEDNTLEIQNEFSIPIHLEFRQSTKL